MTLESIHENEMLERECESGLMNFIMAAIIVIIVCFVSGVAFGIHMARVG